MLYMKKILSFSLWGNKQEYTIGAIKNAELAKIFYPDFECWFYIHEETVPPSIINKLSELSNTKIIIKNGDLSTCKPMMWRFEPIDDIQVEIMMSRDTDTRIYLREKLAVDQWLKSGKIFHIMRDHPDHNFKILGGMFGTRKIPQIDNWTKIMLEYKQTQNKFYDQNFLNEFIYPLIKDNSLIHASFNCYENNCENFPIDYDQEYNFVGGYVYENESRSLSHINILKEAINNKNKLKINLITSFYIINKDDEQSKTRNNELLECLYKNLQNDLICKIHLFVDDIKSSNKAMELNINNKIKIINIGKQPLYSEMFEYAIDNLKDKISMVSNSDIYLHKCDLNVLNKLSNNVFALSRHESDYKCHVIGWGSHDAFIFNSTYIKKDILKNIEHIQNIAGSDDNIINNLVDSGLKLYNPCFEIIIIHLHDSQLRTYNNNKIANGKYFIKQQYFVDNYQQKQIDNYIWYPGIDHCGDDLLFKQNKSIKELKIIADDNEEIIAFNTLGFMKSKIDIKNLKSTPWINNTNSHGIYVKNKK